MRLRYDAKSQNCCLTKLLHGHNHTTSTGKFKHYMYTANRKLHDEQGDVMAFIDLKVETKNIKSYIRDKTIQTKDISNIRLNLAREQEGG